MRLRFDGSRLVAKFSVTTQNEATMHAINQRGMLGALGAVALAGSCPRALAQTGKMQP